MSITEVRRPVEAAAPRTPALRVLFVAPYVPSPIRVRPYQLLCRLAARGHKITLICPASGADDAAALERLRPLCAVVPVDHGLVATGAAYLRALPGRLPLQAAHCLGRAFVGAVRDALAGGGFDVVHIEHLRGAEVARSAAAGLTDAPPLVLDAVDSISLLFERALRRSPTLRTKAMALLDLARTRRYEAAYSRRFAQIVITSAEDRWAIETLRRQLGEPPGAPITVVPNGVDSSYFAPSDAERDAGMVLFSGKMSYHANEAAAISLLHEVMPQVWRQWPAARVVIAGARPGPRILALGRDPRVEVTGFVPDLRPYLARATVAVAPLLYGVGVQNKVLEAMACATPVVAARQATVALSARPGRDLLVADSPADFARLISAALEDAQWRGALGRAGRAYVERNHSWEHSVMTLEQCYQAAIRSSVA